MKKTSKIPYYMTVASAAMFMMTRAMADTHWTGAAGNNDWNNAGNWDNGVPSASNYSVFIDPATGSPTIGAGEIAVVGQTGVDYPMVFGPEWGQTLNIYGSLTVAWYLTPVGNTSVINLYSRGSYTGEGIGLGENWWYNAAPGVTMNQYGGTVNINYFFWGGYLNLSGGTFTISDSLGVTADTSAVSDANRMIDISGGELIIAGDATSMVQNWESRNIIEGNGVLGNINIDVTSDPGFTVITAAPEPTSMALLGLGSLAFLLRRRSVS